MDKLSDTDADEKTNNPSPADFDTYLPWACVQMQLPYSVVITKLEQDEYTPYTPTDRGKSRKGLVKQKSEVADPNSETKQSGSNSVKSAFTPNPSSVYIYTIYDNNDCLIQLKFLKNNDIPRCVLKIICLIIPFQKNLTSVYVNRGLKKDSLYELNKIVALSTITELILDNTSLPEANYYLFLDGNSNLKYMSLAKCNINDAVVKALTSRLVPPYQATRNLIVLNLSSNRITDIGAKHVGDMLKVNRKLAYLNLAGNMINDSGAESILNSLTEFRVTPNDITQSKARHMTYLRTMNELVTKYFQEMREDFYKKDAKRKQMKPVPVLSKKKIPEDINQSTAQSMYSIEAVCYDKAVSCAERQLGSFDDAFKSDNLITRERVTYCIGNNVLCYLSLAYNNLSYISVKKLYKVLNSQEQQMRKPKGLLNVCIEGNNLPASCLELTEIDIMLSSGLTASRKTSMTGKKKVAKVGTR